MLNRKQAKEKRRIFLHFSLACLHHPDHLFPEKNESVIQDFVVMIVSEQPVMKPGSFFDFFQIICQGIMGISSCAQLVYNTAGSTVGDDIVHFMPDTLQIVSGFFIFRSTRKLLFPPGTMVYTETDPHPAECTVLFFKIWSVGIQYTVFHIVAPCSTHTVVFIPEYYFRIIDDAANKKRYFYIADKAKSGFTKHPGSGKYVGRYNTISGHYSKTGAAPLVNLTRASARSGARGKGSKWSEYDFASWCAVWLLYLVEFSDWDSQSKIGRGYVDGNSSAISSGGTDSMTYHTGRAAGTNGKTAVQYRHIENPYGNVFEFIDGINFSDGTVYVCLNPASYADDTAANYTNIGSKIQSDGYITAIGVAAAMPWAFFPTGVGGSETTYIPDYVYYSSGWRVLFVGGNWNNGGNAGLFYFNANNTSSNTNSNVGARLLVFLLTGAGFPSPLGENIAA